MTSQKRDDIHVLIDTLKTALDAIGAEIDKDSESAVESAGDTGQCYGGDDDYDETVDQMLALLCKFSAFDISPEDFEVVGIHELGSGDLRVSLEFRKDAPDRKDGVAISFNEIAGMLARRCWFFLVVSRETACFIPCTAFTDACAVADALLDSTCPSVLEALTSLAAATGAACS